jgi:hypothetical protein
MTRHDYHPVAIIVGLLAVESTMYARAGHPVTTVPPDGTVERHHYSMTARVRPLLFWISRSGIGDAVVTKRSGPDRSGYSLLIGSDPDRAPRRINRWGYIDEEIHGAEANLIGLMTEADEQSVEEAEAHMRQAGNGDRTYQMIQATIDGDHARSVVTAIGAPEDYSFRQVRVVLDLARRESSTGQSRVIRLPTGTRPGFLCALAELMHLHVQALHASAGVHTGDAISYVYHGRLYRLRATRVEAISRLRVGSIAYQRVIAADFEIKNTYTGELTQFSMTYGSEGRLAEVPLTMSYQPRWWMQIDLALDDTTAGPALGDGLNPRGSDVHSIRPFS